MAEWKKIIVSGSNVSQLTNDAGYLTSVTAQTAFVTASFNGTHLIADNSEGQLNFASSSGQGLTIAANSGTDTLTFGLSSIPNTSLENDGITIAGQDTSLGGSITADTIAGQISNGTITNDQLVNKSISFGGISLNLGGSDATPAFNLQDATNYPFTSLTSVPVGLVSGSAQIDHDQTTNFNADEHFTQANITTVGTVTTGDVSAILPEGTVSGSITSPSQGTISINGNNIDLGVQTGDSPQFTNLTVTGDLTVQGTQTSVNTTNLLVEDRFALFNSGSATGDGGIIVQTESDFSGVALGYDDSEGRFGLQIGTKLAQNADTLAPDAYIASVVTSADANYEKNGNIRVQGGDIFIYVES